MCRTCCLSFSARASSNLAWKVLGSEFAGRHQQYEKFYAGASFIVRNHSYRETPWDDYHAIVDGLMASYDIPTEAEMDARWRDLSGAF